MMWAPIDFAALSWLPKRGQRPYSKVEALLALQSDYWHRRLASLRGYEEQWGWGRRRVHDFLKEVGVEIVGQVGQRPGQLQPRHRNDTANDTANDTVTTPQIFRDFGQIGDSQNKNDTANDTAPGQKTTDNYIQYRKIDNHPPTPIRGEQVEELAEKVLVGELKKGRKIKNLQGYKNSIAARLEIQGGLSKEEKEEMTPSWHNPEIEKTRKYLQSLGFGE